MTKINTAVEQTDFFSLFDIEDEYSKQKKKEEEERIRNRQEMAKKMAESNSTTSSPKAASESKKLTITNETIILFFNEEIPVKDYFSDEELLYGIMTKGKDGEESHRDIEAKDIKARMKKDYPILAADAAIQNVKHNKKDYLVIIMQAKKKGSEEESISDSSSAKAAPFKFKKIPFSLLKDFISIAKHFEVKFGTEVHADVYQTFDGEHYLDIPKQVANDFWVEVTESVQERAEISVINKSRKVMEIHSHHTLEARPSRLDDKNERNSAFIYTIIGRTQDFFPQLSVRTFNEKYDRYINLSPFQVFEYPFRDVSNYPVENVTIHIKEYV